MNTSLLDKTDEITVTTIEAPEFAKGMNASNLLSYWMNENFDKLFAKTPKKKDYIVGVVDPNDLSKDFKNLTKNPELYSFTNKNDKKPILGIFGKRKKGAIDFMVQCSNEHKISYIIYRTQKEDICIF